MQTTMNRRRRIQVTGGLLVLALSCLAGAEAQAQHRSGYRVVPRRDLRAEAELAAKVAQLNALVAAQQRQAAAAAAAGRRLRPGEIPVNIPVNIPMYGPLTPGQRILHDTLVGRIGGAARAACEARRAAQPYSIYRPGRLNDGWYDTMTGPRPHACF